jgi:mannose-1-phosphate guanylyltransferase
MEDQEINIDTTLKLSNLRMFSGRSRDDLGLRKVLEPGLWGIVLAGGEGERFKELAEKLCGYPRPKQYCAVLGRRSMIQHTLARAEFLMPPERIVVVANESHRTEVQEQFGGRPQGTILFQPQNRETAAGVLLPLTWIGRQDSEAVVVILPSDHFVLEEKRFMAHVRWAKRFIEKEAQEVCVLLGIPAEAPETSYGWIEPLDETRGAGLSRVRAFWEKPDLWMAEYMYRFGWLWNTLVLVARVRTLLQMYKEYLPDLYWCFQRIAPLVGTREETEALREAYAATPAISISQGILQRNPVNLRTLKVRKVLWSDWGSSARVRQTVERIGRLHELASRLAGRGHDPEMILGRTC